MNAEPPSTSLRFEDTAVTDPITRNLRTHVYELAARIGERNVFHPGTLDAADAYITETWAEQGYEVTRQEYETRGVLCANLEVSRPGSSRAKQILLLGAHYDSVLGSPGGNDNGTGVASLLELSRLFSSAEPAMTLRFVAFVNEEPPFFMTREQGSQVYAKAARQRGDDIRLMISLETMGYYRDAPGTQAYPPLLKFFFPDRANFIGMVSNLRSGRWLRRLATAFRASSEVPLQHLAMFSFVPGVGWSDQASFWQQGYHALMVTDTAPYRYPWYHTAEDTPEKVDYLKLAQVTEGLYRALSVIVS